MSPRSRGILFGVIVATIGLRLALVLALPDADADVHGHLVAARGLLSAPGELSVHWVWLPGWHFVLALFVELRAGLLGARIFNAAIAAGGPLVLYYALVARSPRAAIVSAVALAIAPLANLVATSAQSETLFALLLVCGCSALDRRRGWLAGLCLTGACCLRYEAWAAVGALAAGLCVRRRSLSRMAMSPEREQTASGLPSTAIAVGVAAATIFAWCVLRARSDGRWFAFVHETTRFVGGMARGMGVTSFLVYTLIVPLKVFGPAWLLALSGARQAAREAPELARASLGILGFLTLTCLLGGSLGLERHFASLLPFSCVAIGFGVERVSSRVARVGMASLASMLVVHVIVFAVLTRERSSPQPAAAQGGADEGREARARASTTSSATSGTY